jgi:protease I
MPDTNANDHPLTGQRVAILATDGFEESELREPLKALQSAGAEVAIVAPSNTLRPGEIRGWNNDNWSPTPLKIDVQLEAANPDNYDALVLPGGVRNPDKLRVIPKAVEFVRHFFERHKPVAAICHAPWLLVEADVVRNRTVTSYKSIRTDLINAGANWVDKEVVVDNGLVTSRQPSDLPAFCAKMVEEIAEGRHAKQHA